MRKPCLDCGRPTPGSRCPPCRARAEAERDAARGTPTERGYDAQFAKAKRDPSYLAAVCCTSCGEPFTTDNPRTAGHITALRLGGGDGAIAAQCRRCNFGWRRTGT